MSVRAMYLMKSVLIVFLWLITVSVSAQRAIPKQEGVWVHDEANILSANTESQLNALLRSHEDSTSNQIGVLVVSSLEGEDIEGYAIRVFKEWKIGQEGKDNGVLFVIAVEDRMMRMEVGYGLEGVLTDALTSRIQRNEVAPFFREGNYEAGIVSGTLAIIQSIEGEYVNDAPLKKKSKRSPIGSVIFVLILILVMAGRNRGGGSGRGGAGGYWTAAMLGSMLGRGMGGGGGGGFSGGSFGGGGFSGGGGSSSSW